ncbi:hypothetical protein EVAR_26005_1 [Eumeta japonica]|uniref:Uncharacterized protein n=1 Tax=Eumeta variegata TaxID=151549 RepID=A0A4C1V3J0_EUMVA|nr:hypothetical protein EVAR_26005_1 [Eumeta japonica]
MLYCSHVRVRRSLRLGYLRCSCFKGGFVIALRWTAIISLPAPPAPPVREPVGQWRANAARPPRGPSQGTAPNLPRTGADVLRRLHNPRSTPEKSEIKQDELLDSRRIIYAKLRCRWQNDAYEFNATSVRPSVTRIGFLALNKQNGGCTTIEM